MLSLLNATEVQQKFESVARDVKHADWLIGRASCLWLVLWSARERELYSLTPARSFQTRGRRENVYGYYFKIPFITILKYHSDVNFILKDVGRVQHFDASDNSVCPETLLTALQKGAPHIFHFLVYHDERFEKGLITCFVLSLASDCSPLAPTYCFYFLIIWVVVSISFHDHKLLIVKR